MMADLIQRRAHDGRAHIVGLSLGGYTALHLLANHPQVVLSTIISGVAGRPLPRPELMNRLVGVMSHLNRWGPVISVMARLMQLPAEVRPLYRRDSRRLSPETSRRIYREVINFDLPDALLTKLTPLLAVAGEKESKMIVDTLSGFAQLPVTKTAIIPNAHHGWNGEFPERFNKMIIDSIDSIIQLFD